MALSPSQTDGLLAMAGDHWLQAATARFRYERELQRVLLLGTWLNRGTVVAGLLTALSTVPGNIPEWATMVAGLATAAVAVADRIYAPSTKSVELSDIVKRLELVRNDIAAIALRFDGDVEFEAMEKALTTKFEEIQEAKRMPLVPNEKDRSRAAEEFAGSTPAVLKARHDASTDEPGDDPPPAVAAAAMAAPSPAGQGSFDGAVPAFAESTDAGSAGLAEDAPDVIGTARPGRVRP